MRPTQSLQTEIETLAWLAGHWQGKLAEDDVEEVWTAPQNGSLLGMFRWFRDGKIRVIEIITIANFDGEIHMKFKHFDEKLNSWEAQNETTDFVLVETSPTAATFHEVGKEQWLFYKRNRDKLTVHFERATPRRASTHRSNTTFCDLPRHNKRYACSHRRRSPRPPSSLHSDRPDHRSRHGRQG